jgi:hypothetical protein
MRSSFAFPGDFIKIFESVVDAYQKQLGAIAITVRIHAHSVNILHSPLRFMRLVPQPPCRQDYSLRL